MDGEPLAVPVGKGAQAKNDRNSRKPAQREPNLGIGLRSVKSDCALAKNGSNNGFTKMLRVNIHPDDDREGQMPPQIH